ncbi:MAG TPA: hypothetical protein VGG01_08890 [Xanthobacteraceae bacterium]|jgi:hypothetical protein
MRAFSALLLVAAGMALCTSAVAQDRKGTPTSPRTSAPAATTGAAPSEPAAQAPIGHRQPRANAEAGPGGGINFAPVSPYDQEIDRNLNICRGC